MITDFFGAVSVFFLLFSYFFFILNFTCFISLTITMRLTEGDILYLGDLTFYILVNLWTVYVGVLRVHQQKVHDHVPTAEDEQWKRGFWYVILYPISFDT